MWNSVSVSFVSMNVAKSCGNLIQFLNIVEFAKTITLYTHKRDTGDTHNTHYILFIISFIIIVKQRRHIWKHIIC